MLMDCARRTIHIIDTASERLKELYAAHAASGTRLGSKESLLRVVSHTPHVLMRKDAKLAEVTTLVQVQLWLPTLQAAAAYGYGF